MQLRAQEDEHRQNTAVLVHDPGALASSPPAEPPAQRLPLRVALPRLRLSARARQIALYGGAALSYVAIGVFVTEFALSWVVAFAWLLLWVCGLPALVRRIRG